MTTSTGQLSAEMTKEMINLIIKTSLETELKIAKIYWDSFISILYQYWLMIMIILIVIFIIALIKAIMGRWGMLGKVLYRYIYFGTLLIIGLIFGPGVFLRDFFHLACAIILYPVCYHLVGFVLNITGLKSR